MIKKMNKQIGEFIGETEEKKGYGCKKCGINTEALALITDCYHPELGALYKLSIEENEEVICDLIINKLGAIDNNINEDLICINCGQSIVRVKLPEFIFEMETESKQTNIIKN